MRIARTAQFKKAWEELTHGERELARKAIVNLAMNLAYPALRTKKIKGTDNIWEARVSRSLRLTFQIEHDIVVLRNIGRHDETLENP